MSGTEVGIVLPDIPRFYTALAEWLACLMCILEMKKRLPVKKMAVLAAAALVVQVVFLEVTGDFDDFLWIICMVAAIGLMYGFMYLSCDMNWKDVGYYCVRAFVVAELAASLEWQIDCFFSYGLEIMNPGIRAALLIIIYGLVYLIVWIIYRKASAKEEGLYITNKELVSSIIIGIAVFSISNLGFVSIQTPFASPYMTEIFNVRTVVDLGGVAILYAYHVQRIDLRVRHELESVENILHNQYMQYQQSQEAMDIINYKYHDLKHYIIALRAEENDLKKKEYLDKMEEEVRDYESQNATGNKVLDTMLTSKNLYCMKNGISMTCVVDGALFDFMDVMDICSIFGNALDNAIECEKKIEEKEKRLIHVTAFSQKRFLIIRFENYYEGVLKFEEELPVTTKDKKHFHGYGLKSIRYTVRKYGGEVDISAQDNWFILKILIPI